MPSRPDKPLVVKCTFDRESKRISFKSARNCTYDLLRQRVNQCFPLSSKRYVIQYTDDDGETSDIKTEDDLTEAIQYFNNGSMDDSSSLLSGFSLTGRKITLRVEVMVEYDGISLSDTSSLASLEEYSNRNHSQGDLPFNISPPEEIDDDSVTVSSRDTGAISPSRFSDPFRSTQDCRVPSPSNLTPHAGTSQQTVHLNAKSPGSTGGRLRKMASSLSGRGRRTIDLEESAAIRFPENPSAVFERLRYEELNASETSSVAHGALDRNSRGAAWLRDQNELAIRNVLGDLPSDSDDASLSLEASSLSLEDDVQSSRSFGDLSLQSDDRGKQYYSYRPARSSASQSMYGESGVNYENEGVIDSISLPGNARPTSMQLDWLAAQQKPISHVPSLPSLQSHKSDPLPFREPLHENGVPRELLQFLPPPASPPSEQVTDCSACGMRLDTIRYICSTCGPKSPMGHDSISDKGKSRESPIETRGMTYPPSPSYLSYSISPSNSSRTLIGDLDAFAHNFRHKPLPSLPAMSVSPGSSSSGSGSQSLHGPGYELCSGCLETAGVIHAKEGATIPALPPSPQDPMNHGSGSRSKAQLRHAFQEKVWGHNGWDDVEHDESKTSKCSFCNATNLRKSYKCASCKHLNVCRACYSQIHELHPLHAFLVVPERRVRSHSEPEHIPTVTADAGDEESMKHPGVKCSHCLQDIVGARFHCLLCESVDICSNCESAGLPGNLDSSDGGHTSAHVMIKIPYPLESTELQRASQRAINLWQHRDGVNISHATSDADLSSAASSYARTVVGSGVSNHPLRISPDDHGTICRGCNKPIVGIRYQCATCPSKPAPYSLCGHCDERSWHVHNPYHVFLKLPRPVDRPLESERPILPPLYQAPVAAGYQNLDDPKGYLRTVVHITALCDCCMDRIEGEWYRCAYCSRDLCGDCESIDAHDESHIFMVLKAPVDMNRFKAVFQDFDNPNGESPVIPHAVYTKQQY